VVEGVLLGIGFVVLLDAFFGERGLVEMIRGLEHYDRLEKDVTSIKQQNDQLREQIDGLTNDPDVIEDRARREQHLIKPGERVFIIRDQPEGSEPER
jgi:cell division protein FtsB